MFFGFCRNLRENQKKTKKNISKGGSETFKNFVVFVFPKVFLIVFGFLWYFWFSRRFCWFCKNLRENQKNKKNKKTYPRVGLKPFKKMFVGFSRRFFCLFLVFFGICGFPEGFFGFLKTFGKTKKTKNKKNMGSFQISEISEKYYAFEIWCLECSSLGPTAKISIHLSNSVWLVCVVFCMVLYKFSRFACTP